MSASGSFWQGVRDGGEGGETGRVSGREQNGRCSGRWETERRMHRAAARTSDRKRRGREGGRQEAGGREGGRQEVGAGRWRVQQVAGAWRRKIFPGGEKREKAGRAHGMLGVRKRHWPGFAGNEKAILAKAQW